MGQTVYVDLFFMINFSMDFLCFFLAAELLGSKLKLGRTLIAAAIGGIYANIALFMPIGGIWEILIDISICVLMCFTAYGGHISVLASHTCVYIAISTVLGGFMTALFSLLNRAELPLDSLKGDGISAWLLLLLALISGGITLAGGKHFRRRSTKKYTDVKIFFNGQSKTLSAFCDSGNLLRDPISGKACIIADADSLYGIIPKEIIKCVKDGSTDISCLNTKLVRKVRLIPTRTATGDGLLIAVRVDKIIIGTEKNEKEVSALLAIGRLGASAAGCEALVPSELII